MKIGIISDSHKHIKNLSRVVEFLKNMNVELIIHLGDDYADVDEIGATDIVRVPGVFSDFYQDPAIPNRRIENFMGWRVLLTHTVLSHENDLLGDPKPEDLINNKKIDIVLYGHTHVPEIRRENNVVFINPGHLKDEDKRGYLPTFGYLEIIENELLVRIYTLKDYTIFKEEKLRR